MGHSLLERNEILRKSWIDARHRVPEADPAGPHFSITVIGIISDPHFINAGDKEFVDFVAWWPAAQKWTVTHQCRADTEATDFPVNVIAWQPAIPLPW